MRIFFLVSCVTAHDEKFVRSLSTHGHSVHIFSFHHRRVDEALLALPNVSITFVPLRTAGRVQRFMPLHLLPKLKRAIKEFQPDVIHGGNTWNESFLAALSGFHPLIVVPYGSDVLIDTQRLFWFRYANTKVFREADWVSCDAEHVKRKIIKDFAYPAEKITVIPWGIEVDEIARKRDANRDAMRKALRWEDNFILIMTRNHEPVYGIDVFLRALQVVAKSNSSIRVIMIGGGPLTGAMQQMAKEFDVDRHILWTGKIPRPELLRHLYAADLYVSSSHSDGTSVSLLEAMAARLSVVLTYVPSNLEWITSGVNGEIVPRGDHQALARAILGLAADPERNARYAKTNLEKARARADWDGNYLEFEKLYRHLAGGDGKK
jgi:glycosyltransferase involved in cell wall biosynthesis